VEASAERTHPRGRAAIFGLLVPALVGVAGAAIALFAFGHRTTAVGPLRVEMASRFGDGTTEIRLPPFGTLSADTHASPIRLSAELRDVDVAALTELVRTRSTDQIVAMIERRSVAQLRPLAWRVLWLSAIGGGVLGALVYRRNLRRVAVAGLSAVLVTGAVAGGAWMTFDPGAFRSPTYSGSLAVAARLIGPVRQATERIDDIRAELTRVVDGAIRAYASVQGTPLGGDDFVKVLHISDIHLNPLGMDFALEVAEGFDVDLVIDTGDLISFGTSAEEAVTSLIPRFDRPYVYVRGNHDSRALGAAIAALPNGVVLDRTTARVAGLQLYGMGHPVFTPDAQAYGDDRFERLARTASVQISTDLAELPRPPDIVAVHDDRMVESLAGRFPLAVSGHFHETSWRSIGGSAFLRIGTTGGSGATVFTVDEGIPFSAQVLYLEPSADGEPARLVAWDVITQVPGTGSLTVDRHLADEEFAQPVPAPTSTPSPLEPTATSPTGT
jgi:predicted phosphodiesterase